MKKKGNILDVATAIAWIFGIMITLFIMYTVLTNFGSSIQDNAEINETGVIEPFNAYKTKYVAAVDYGCLFLFLILPIVSFMAARKIPSDTIYMLITFFVLGFILIFSMVFTNIYGAMLDNATFLAFNNVLVFLPFILKNLLYYSILYIFIVCLGLFTKTEVTTG